MTVDQRFVSGDSVFKAIRTDLRNQRTIRALFKDSSVRDALLLLDDFSLLKLIVLYEIICYFDLWCEYLLRNSSNDNKV